ncbi:hypothetical protein H9P43_006617 [Blastocladiella emersonii ATCC 22665]|nr:hypothetical protein H9P43_006617 [Blastocladiella emersonii ATCC 22665]
MMNPEKHGSGSIWFAVSDSIEFSTIVCGIFTAITVPTFVILLLRSIPFLAGYVYAPWGTARSTPRIRLLTLLSFLAGADAVNNFTTYMDLWTSGSTSFTSAQVWFMISFVPFGMCLTLTVAHRNSLIVVSNATWRKRFMAVVYLVCAAVFIFQEVVGISNLVYLIQKDDPDLWSSVSLLPGYAVVPMCAYPVIIVTGSLMSLRIAFTNSFLTIEATTESSSAAGAGSSVQGTASHHGKLSSNEAGSRSITHDPASPTPASPAPLLAHKEELSEATVSASAMANTSAHSLKALTVVVASTSPLKGSVAALPPPPKRSVGLQVPVTSTFKVLTVVFILDWILMLLVLLWPTLIPIQPGTVLTATGVTALLAEISFESMLKSRRKRQARKGRSGARVAQDRKSPS